MLNSKLYGECSLLRVRYRLKWRSIPQFLTRDAMLARYMLSSCVRLSVRPSVRPSQAAVLSNVIHQRVIERKNKQTKTVCNKHQSAIGRQDHQAVSDIVAKRLDESCCVSARKFPPTCPAYCVIRKFRHLRKLGHFSLELCPTQTPDLDNFAAATRSRSRQNSSSSSSSSKPRCITACHCRGNLPSTT